MNQFSEDKKHKIIISGSSWGCGEWDKGDVINHKGLEQYFIDDGFTVVNASVGGHSNKQSILAISDIIPTNQDIVLWIQSDPVSELRPFTSLTDRIKKSRGIANLKKDLLNEQYSDLSAMASRFDIVVYAIGGREDLNLELLKQYHKIVPCVESWVRLLIGHMEKYVDMFPQGTYNDWTIRDIRLQDLDSSLAEQVINEIWQLDQNLHIYKEAIFNPDGRHPNRLGHKILFDYLIKELKL